MTVKWYDSKPRMVRVRLSPSIDYHINKFAKSCEEMAFIGSQPKEDWAEIQENHAVVKERLRKAIRKQLDGKSQSNE